MGQTQSAEETRELLAAVCLLNEKLPVTRIPLHIAPILERTLEFQEAKEARSKPKRRGIFSGLKRVLGSQAIEGSDFKLL